MPLAGSARWAMQIKIGTVHAIMNIHGIHHIINAADKQKLTALADVTSMAMHENPPAQRRA